MPSGGRECSRFDWKSWSKEIGSDGSAIFRVDARVTVQWADGNLLMERIGLTSFSMRTGGARARACGMNSGEPGSRVFLCPCGFHRMLRLR